MPWTNKKIVWVICLMKRLLQLIPMYLFCYFRVEKISKLVCAKMSTNKEIITPSMNDMTNNPHFPIHWTWGSCQCFPFLQVDVNSTTDNLISTLRTRLHRKVDILLFNPPYVVTPHEEVGGHDLSAAWAGGVRGREVIDRFLPLVDEVLSACGVLYLLLLEQNDPDDVTHVLSGYGLDCTVVLRRRAGPEHLLVLRASRSS